MYADILTESMKKAIEEMKRRRTIQSRYNQKYGIVPETIVKSIDESLWQVCNADFLHIPKEQEVLEHFENREEVEKEIEGMQKDMKRHADALEFEKAAEIRDRIKYLKERVLML